MTGTIELLIAPDGTVTLATKGIEGPACRDASRFLEATLGERRSETLLPEYFQPARALVIQQKQRT
jgi:hypothetical protein